MNVFERIEDSVDVIANDHGESFTRVSFFFVPMEHPEDEVKAWVDDNFPSRHCQHSYDCCANWYPARGRFFRVPFSNLLIVHQDFGCNI